uniref:40S ribosomal protein S13 n=1 Tax=Rhinolophus ferrumequinum TaxID=59479 RepID=A0A671FS22_RHIFE
MHSDFPALPWRRSHPRNGLKLRSATVMGQIYKLTKKGQARPQTAVTLRDSHGVAQVHFVRSYSIVRLLKSKGLAPDLPQDFSHLIKNAAVGKHLERNRKDKDAKFHLILIESCIHWLARYQKPNESFPLQLEICAIHRLCPGGINLSMYLSNKIIV